MRRDTGWGDPRGLGQRLMESAAVVAIYESRLWRRNPLFRWVTGIGFEAELAAIVRLSGIAPASSVLDLACGPGIYTRPLARALSRGRAVGLDLSRAMLRHASRRARAERLGNLWLVRGSALALPFGSEAFQAVNCCGAVHLFADVPHALREIRRVLAPGGRFTSAVFRRGESPWAQRTAARRQRLAGVHAFGRAEYEQLLADAGFRDLRVAHARRSWMIVGALRPA